MKIAFKFPRFKGPLSNPVGLARLQERLFGKKRQKLTWRRAGIYSLWFIAFFVIIVVFLFAWFAKDLPTPNKIRNLVAAGSTRLYDRNMKPLYTISGEKKRILVDSNQIPDVVRQATISLEDKTFYKNFGVDPKGIARAVFVDIFTRSYRQGGSTITQQLVKNTILTKQKTAVRKIKEVILSIELEILFSKDEILTMYLNQIPYGGNNYGIEAAARSYFGKSAKDLTLDEAATLAALPQAPTTLSPYGSNVDKLITRRNFTLRNMNEMGYITLKQMEEAIAVEPHFSLKQDSITAPHFVLYTKDWLVEYFTKELGDSQLAEQRVEEGGLTVVTTIDLDHQIQAEDVVGKSRETTLKKAGASNAGLVCIDPQKGDIIAMVGSVDYNNAQFGNYNVTTASRQPGSSFKPVVYAAAFKEKYNPAYNIFDLRTDFGNYTPDNYDGGFRGPLSIRSALGNSLNIPAVKILSLVGLDKALKTASDMGITTLTDKNRYGLALVLGGGEVKPLEMATAFGVFANGGVLVPTAPVIKITDANNKTILDRSNPKNSKLVLDPQIAYEITSILSDTNAKKPIFARVMNVLTLKDRKVAVKTGTTDEFRDAWTIGYTKQYVTSVWVGNNDNSKMNPSGGAIAAAPIWHDFMDKIHSGLPNEDFPKPDGIKEVTVDRLSNKLPVDGSEPIKDIFASWQVPTEKDDVHIKTRVCRENGLLADSNIPDSLAEIRSFNYVRSERPDNPKWENPVRAWASANGYNNKPPTEKCSAGNVAPTVNITSPADNGSVSGIFTVSADAAAASGVRSVEFLIDNVSIGTDTESPFSMQYNSSLLSTGPHILTATVTSNSGSTASDQITFNVSNDNQAPSDVTGFTGSSSDGKVTLSWAANPPESDFKLVRIYVLTEPGAVQVRTVDVNKPDLSVVISLLTVGQQYKFIAKSVDNAGNESSGKSIILQVN